MDHELLGLTAYEGKVYRALLAHGPLTAYAAGKAAGVPLSRVYEVPARLAEKGFARCVEGEPLRYEAAPHEQVIADARRRLRRDLDELSADLSSAARVSSQSDQRSVRGSEQVLETVRTSAAPGSVIVAGPAARAVSAAAVSAGATVMGREAADVAGPGSFVLLCADGLLVTGTVDGEPSAVVMRNPLLNALCRQALLRPARRAQHGVSDVFRHAESGRAWIDWEAQKHDRLLSTRRPS